MQTVFGLFSLENAEAVVGDLQQRLGADEVNLILSESAKERLATGPGQPAQVAAPTLAQLLSRKRAIFLGETGLVIAVHALAVRVFEMATSQAATKTTGSLKVALEEYGAATSFAAAYAAGVQHGYVLVFASVPDDEVLEITSLLGSHGGREVFTFQRLD